MAETAWEMVWLWLFLDDLGISSPFIMPMHCDNQASIFITGNSTFNERTKHIEIDCHYIWDKVMFEVISTPHVASSNQLVEVFIKSLARILYDATCTKLGMFDLYAPAWGGVFDSGIGLSAHLSSPFIFTSYIRTFVLSFPYTILGFLCLIVNRSKMKSPIKNIANETRVDFLGL